MASDYPRFDVAHGLVRAAAWVVPPFARSRWEAEWHAELYHERRYLLIDQQRRFAALPLALVAWGAIRDARAMRRLHGAPSSPRLSVSEGAHTVIRELRHALRSLRRNPGFAAVAIATLAIGIGANTAIFSVLNGVLLRPLPYPSADRVVALAHRAPGLGSQDRWGISQANHFYYKDNVQAFEQVATFRSFSGTLTGVGPAEVVRGVRVTASTMDLLGARAHLGRLIAEADDLRGAPDVTLLSHEAWRTKFGADPEVIGRSVELNGSPFEVIGVLAPEVQLPYWAADFWMPIRLDPGATPQNAHTFFGIARLREGVAAADAETEVNTHVARFPEIFPTAYTDDFMTRAAFRAEVYSLHEDIVGDVRAVLWILLGSVSLVLLIACANVANLFLVRSEGRRREVALRQAVGATGTNLIRYFLSESLLLAAVGGVVGIGLAAIGVKALIGAAPATIPRLDSVSIDGTTLAFTVLVSVFAGLAFGVLPVARFGRTAVSAALRDGGGGALTARGRFGGHRALIVGEVALGVLLLVAAGFMLKSFNALRSVDPGFTPRGAVAFDVTLAPTRYPDHETTAGFYRQVMDRLRVLPGVETVGGVNYLPLQGSIGCFGFFAETMPPDQGPPCVPVRFIAPGYFAAMQIPIIAGRELHDDDIARAGSGMVISSVLAEQMWPGDDPIGKGVRIMGRPDGPDQWYRVVGVAGPVRGEGLEEPEMETAYFPIRPSTVHRGWTPMYGMTFIVRGSGGEPAGLVPAIRGLVAELDPNAPVSNVRTLEQLFAEAMAQSSLAMVLIGIAASVALLLGVVGIYGVISFVVSQRTQEVGLRIALGADAGRVSGMVLKEALQVTAIGVGLGIGAAVVLQRILGSVLFGVGSSDVGSILVAIVAIGTAAGVASYLPARRAARVDPMVALRA